MSRSKKSGINTIDIIDKGLYDYLQKEAKDNDKSLRQYVNEILSGVWNLKLIRTNYHPEISMVSRQGNTIVLKEASNEKGHNKTTFTEIKYEEGKLTCSTCPTKSECEHLMYASLLPAFGTIAKEPERRKD